jgi:alpha-galactosidase
MSRSISSPKIVIVGAGSASFGPNTLASLIRSPLLSGSTLALVDLDAAALDRAKCVAQRMNETWGAEMSICASTDRCQVLQNADFVVVSIEVPPREKLWRLDWEIPMRHGLHQPYGENGGPGGMMHTFRQVPPLMAIVRDMETLCPDAWLINFSNPLPRLTRAITKYSQIKTVGKCHQIEVGYAIAGVLLRDWLGLDIPEGLSMKSDPANAAFKHQIAHKARERLKITAGGLNHFTWMLEVRDRESGEDLYPMLRQARASAPPAFEPLSMELFELFGYCPVPGDTHLAEYLPWTHDPLAEPWEQYNLELYDWEGNEMLRDFEHHRMGQMARGSLAVDGMRDVISEGAAELIEAISAGLERFDEAVNVPNQGAIPNLPDETIVEVPGRVGARGISPLQLDPLPRPIAELCRREAALVELVVDAAVSGDRALALQALLLDPMVNDIRRAQLILDDYLEEFADFLPQFRGDGAGVLS